MVAGNGCGWLVFLVTYCCMPLLIYRKFRFWNNWVLRWYSAWIVTGNVPNKKDLFSHLIIAQNILNYSAFQIANGGGRCIVFLSETYYEQKKAFL